MITFLRHIFVEDFLLKFFSMVLAIVVWLIVTFASQKETGTTPRVFSSIPVKVMSSAEDVRDFAVSPGTVEVTVQGDARHVQDLDSKSIRALVDLTGVTAARDLRKRVEVSVPPGVTFIAVFPEEVQVTFPPDR